MRHNTRITASSRRESILDAAIALSKEIGYKCITRDAVAERAEIASSLIAVYFPRMIDLKSAVLVEAIKRGTLEVIAQGLAIHDPTALKIPPDLRAKVVSYLTHVK